LAGVYIGEIIKRSTQPCDLLWIKGFSRTVRNKNNKIFDLDVYLFLRSKAARNDVRSAVTWNIAPSSCTKPQARWNMAEIEALKSDVQYFLLPSEEAKVVAECVVVHSPQLSDQETKPVFVEERIKRVLAVISHQGNAYQAHEQGW